MKKLTKKIWAVALAVVMVLAMTVTAMAADSYTITIDGAVNGETYTAYKIFDADYAESGTAVSYTVESSIYNKIKDLSGVAGLTFTQIGETGVYTVVKTDSFDAAKFAADLDTIKAQLTSAGSAKAADNTATISVSARGYYFVDTTLGSLCALDTAKNVEIKEKNEIPSLVKLQKKTAEGTYTDAKLNVAIDDVVYYQITVTNSKGTDKAITVHDKMNAALTLGDIKVTKDGTEVAADNYTVTKSGISDECTFEVVLKENYVKTLAANDAVVITYTATLNNTALADTEYENDAWLTYSEQETTPDEVIVSTAKFDVKKYDGADEEKKNLAGATFKLKDAQGNTIKLVKIGDETYRVAQAGENSAVDTFTTTNVKNITIYGVDADDSYKLEETAAPAGYNKLTADKEVGTISTSGTTTVIEVENNQGTALPSTGGIGTTMFYVIGAILVLGAGVLLVTRRRMSAK